MTVKIFSKIFGYDYALVKRQSTVSRQKIVTLGTLMMIPVVLWCFATFYISRYLLGAGLMASVFSALVLASIVLIIDRSFIATPKMKSGGLMFVMRLSFAVVTTILGALAIDMVVFAGDLEVYRTKRLATEREQEKKDYLLENGAETLRLLKEADEAKARYLSLQQSYLQEMDGSGGTGSFGKGKVAAAKQREAERTMTQWEDMKSEYQSKMVELETEAEEAAEAKISKRGDALLSKIEDLHQFVQGSGAAKIVYWVFFSFVFLLESFFVFYKFLVSETLYEQFLYAEEEAGVKKLQLMRKQKEEILKQDGLLGHRAEKIRNLERETRLVKML